MVEQRLAISRTASHFRQNSCRPLANGINQLVAIFMQLDAVIIDEFLQG